MAKIGKWISSVSYTHLDVYKRQKQTSVEPVVAPETEDYALTSEHIEKVCAEYDKLTEEYVKRYDEGRGFNFFHFMVDLDQGPCAIKRLSGCGAGHEYLADVYKRQVSQILVTSL